MAAVVAARRTGGCEEETALPFGCYFSRGAGDASDAAVPGRDEPTEDMCGNSGDVSQDVGAGCGEEGKVLVAVKRGY